MIDDSLTIACFSSKETSEMQSNQPVAPTVKDNVDSLTTKTNNNTTRTYQLPPNKSTSDHYDELLAKHIQEEEQRLYSQDADRQSKKLAKKLQSFDQEKTPLSIFSDINNNNKKNAENIQEGLALKIDAYDESEEAMQLEKQAKMIAFLDLDNCPGELATLSLETLPNKDVIVYVFGGPHLPKMPVAALPELANLFQMKILRLVHTNASAKNAADFALAFWCGLVHNRVPLHVPFLIISKDKGLRNVIYQLKMFNRFATIVTDKLVDYLKNKELLTNALKKSTLPELLQESLTITAPSNTSAANTADDNKLEEKKHNNNNAESKFSLIETEAASISILDKLLKISASQRPKGVKGFLNFITSTARCSEENTKLIMNYLTEQNHVLVEGSQVHYLF